MRKRIQVLMVLVVFILFFGNCMTYFSLRDVNQINKIYGGTRYNMDLMFQSPGDQTGMMVVISSAACIFSTVDFPFSFVADTIVLPYTIPHAIMNEGRESEEMENSESTVR